MSAGVRSVSLRAPAKLNLTLAVRGRRTDGYHELDTVMMAIELGDRLDARGCAEGVHLELRGPAVAGVPGDASNLAVRAAQEVQALARTRGLAPGGVALVLEKHVPSEAGLGGGSSDAAAAALACARLWGLDPDDPEFIDGLSRLGSDCAFFLAARHTGLARCTGRGECVEPWPKLDLPWTLAVLTPAFGCPTAATYASFASEAAVVRRPPLGPDELFGPSLEATRAGLFNDLEAAARRACPELEPFRCWLEEEAGGVFQLAGSGSSWFGFFPDEGAARDLLARLTSSGQGRRFALRGAWLGPARSRGMEG